MLYRQQEGDVVTLYVGWSYLKGQGVHEELGADLDLRRAAARIRTREAYGAHAPFTPI